MSLVIKVDADLAVPVYDQIREQVVRMVMAGTLAPGTRLPTIRQLAKDLQLAKGTVAKAYSELESARVVESNGHRGTFVSAFALEPAQVDASVDTALADAAESFAITARQLGVGLDQAIDQVRRRWEQF